MKRRPDGGLSKWLTLPHPGGGSLSVAGARRFAPVAVLGGLVGAGAALAGGLVQGIPGVVLAAAVTLPVVVELWRRSRTFEVHVVDEAVVLPGGQSLPKGRGNLLVECEAISGSKGELRYVWNLSHVPSHTVIASGCRSPLVVRAAAEGLAVAGRWPLVWRPLGGASETRRPDALDVPLAAREALEPTVPPPAARPVDALYEVSERASGGVSVRAPRWRGFARLGWPVVVASAFVSASVVVTAGGFAGLLPVGLVLVLVGAASSLMPDFEVGPEGVTLRYPILGRALTFTRSLPAAEVESLFIDSLRERRLVVVGDRFYKVLARPETSAEAEWLRGVVVRELLGGDAHATTSPAVPAASPSAGSSSAAGVTTDDSSCPACAHVGLEHVGGALDEQRCPACDGRFLPAHGSERLVEGELGIGRDVLRELASYFGGERRRCPSCRSRTSAVRLKGVTADLCQGCGGLWLDAGELTKLSRGHYDG